jgi:hypothetical protein
MVLFAGTENDTYYAHLKELLNGAQGDKELFQINAGLRLLGLVLLCFC